MKYLLLLFILILCGCSENYRNKLITGKWCYDDMCYDFEPGQFPDNYESLIFHTLEGEIINGQFKIDGNILAIKFPENIDLAFYQLDHYSEFEIVGVSEREATFNNKKSGEQIKFLYFPNKR